MQQNYIYLAAPSQKPKSIIKKPLIITAIIVAVIVVVSIIAIIVAPSMLNNITATQTDTTSHYEYYTTMQKIFAKVCGREIVIEFLKDELKDISTSIELQDFNSYGRIVLNGTKEYIEYKSFNEESDSPDTAIDFIYYEPIDNTNSFIIKSGEKQFQHFNGQMTNEFETLDEAIVDHQQFQK